MSFNKLDASLSASPQLSVDDVALAAKQGFRTVINLRPDGEAPDQPPAATISAAATAQGLAFVHIPVEPGQVDDTQVAEMARALVEQPGPILGYCRTGTRVATLWALTRVGDTDPDTLVNTARDAGYDIEKLRSRLQSA